MLEILVPLVIIFIAVGLIFLLIRKYSNQFEMLNSRFLILLTGVLLAFWWVKTSNYAWLLVSGLLISFGVRIDQKLRSLVATKKYTPHPSMQDLEARRMRVRISNIDYAPKDLYSQTPFEAHIIRRISGSDRPDYWVAELTSPLQWEQNGKKREVSHLVLAAQFVGDQMTRGIKDRPVGIAYVTDQSLLKDEKLAFQKCEYVAIGIIEDISAAA